MGKSRMIKYIIGIGLTITFAFLFPNLTTFMWLTIGAKIREAIVSGDGGQLILASAYTTILNTIQNALLFIACYLISLISIKRFKWADSIKMMMTVVMFIILGALRAWWIEIPWELLTAVITATVIMIMVYFTYNQYDSIHRMVLVSCLVFFAFQWLDIMPVFASGPFGITDIPTSILLASSYLDSDTVLNFVGLAFFVPLFISSWIMTSLFSSHDENIAIEKENHLKEIALESVKSSAIEHRIYQEINSIAHDLKTPLVTIRGLNSLLSMSHDPEKTEAYTQRIDSAVEKMSEMISGFLYESSKQEIDAIELINYMRAQIPVEDENLKISINYDEDLPLVNVNKIRVSRALLNIVENAIGAPYRHQLKIIEIEVAKRELSLAIIIKDNGTGIAKEDLPFIWDPGFSTRNTTGMGLFFVKKIVEDNNGQIYIESNSDGTSVTVLFPGIRKETS